MAYNTVIQQGSFINTGGTSVPVTIKVRSGIDWIRTYNYTQFSQANKLLEANWQFGMPQGSALIYTQGGSALLTVNGFTLVDSSANPVGATQAITAISTATPPLVSTGVTTGLGTGSVVRIFNTAGAPQFGGIDFTINNVTGSTSFALQFAPTLAVAGTAGSYAPINFDPLFYPTRRYITAITQATQAVVTLSVTHGYTVGQQIRFSVVDVDCGMTQLNGLQAEIVAVNLTNNTITVNIDTTSFTAFTFPTNAQTPFTPAQVIPIGEGTDSTIANPNLLDDATVNTGYLGIILGASGVAGTSIVGDTNDVIYWQVGKSFNI